MNRVKYKLHPSEYDLGENEKFYSDMEAKGWRLVKRGNNLSKFIPVEPSRTKYRIEVTSPAFLEETELPEGQLAVFEDCGWEHVAGRGFLHIFRAPEGSDAPEFYADPRQQAETLKGIRRYLWCSAALLLLLVAAVVLFILLNPTSARQYAIFVQRAVQCPALWAGRGLFCLWGVYYIVWSTWKLNRTYRRLKKGEPLDHAPKTKHAFHRLLHPGLLLLSLLWQLLAVGQLITIQERELPTQPDGPYIMLSDIGWEGERTDFMGRHSGITHTASLLADYWETVEYIRTQEDTTVWLRQNIYRLRFPGMAGTLTQSLMETDTLAHGPESFSPVEVEGFDAVWATRYEMVAVRGDMVADTVFLNWADDGIDCQAICAALQAAWES